jgi:hypothetical protein
MRNVSNDSCSWGRKSTIWISNTLHKVKGQLNILFLLLFTPLWLFSCYHYPYLPIIWRVHFHSAKQICCRPLFVFFRALIGSSFWPRKGLGTRECNNFIFGCKFDPKKQLLDADDVIGGKCVINGEYWKLAGAFWPIRNENTY